MKKFFGKVAKSVALAPSLLVSASTAFAGGIVWQPGYGGVDNLDSFVNTVLTVAVVIAALIAVAYLIVNGIKYITSGGDTQKTEEAQKGIIAALIGLIVVGIAWLLVRFVITQILGIDTVGGLES